MAQKYKVLYCAVINDEKHEGMFKVGDADFVATKPLHTYIPNEDALKNASEERIKEWSGISAAGAELLYCEALVRYNEKTENYETYRDYEVHTVLQHAGFPRVDFDSKLDSGKEWFAVDLNTVKAAIKATKEYRDYLDTSELPEQEIYELREEQKTAVEETIVRYKNKKDMLWHAKMRFGKTIAALNLIKKQKFKRTIIITHRPVVEDSWGSDFYHVFSNEDKYAFLTKIQNAEYVLNDDETDEAIDRANDARLSQLVAEDKNFVYFASIQDLRGSKRVGGKFDKNNIVFDINWDFVIIDEAHEGVKTPLGQKVIKILLKDKTRRLDLSGTAYNLFDEYDEKGSVYTWDYVMEQEAKRMWPKKHPGEKNPYEDMPVMHINTFDLEKAIREQGIDLTNKSFTFREFFRTWTGDLSKDCQPIPPNREIGDFVHPEAVRRFLDLLSQGDKSTEFPYVTKDGCNKNRHSLWMVPGVKEAAALSKMLKTHSIFGDKKLFGIANVAGEGDHDEEKNYRNALEHVRKTIENHPNSITLSCGRLTTGVTVKEWTSVFMLSGSETTDAKNYMQTIFRVQSAGKIDGVQKTDAYVYDFAPDRTLLVIASSVLGARKRGKNGTIINDDDRRKAFEDFLEFCPVVAIDKAQFKEFNVQSLMDQINRVQIDRALKSGFTDNGIYDMSQFKLLTPDDMDKIDAIFRKLKITSSRTPLSKAGMAKNNIKQGSKGSSGKTGPGNKHNHEEDEQKKVEKYILEKIRTISIRLPLLFFGGDFEMEVGRLNEIVTNVDPVSWSVFMPENFTKDDFKELVKYYNQENVIGAGKIIRSKALEADSLPPTERVRAITDIFGDFHNPSKETVLTPWRVVNLHMTNTLGGWCFYNETFEENTNEYYKRLSTPEFINRGENANLIVSNPDATILEINSKSGLYPLYATYCIYRAKLGDKKESEFLPEQLTKIWDESVKQVYVLCQSSMAADITKRTLIGFRDVETNIKYDELLLSSLKVSIDQTSEEIIKGSYWDKEVEKMKFSAVVGNPPYQETVKLATNGNNNNTVDVYPYFKDVAVKLAPVVSLIYPAKELQRGKTNTLDETLVKVRIYNGSNKESEKTIPEEPSVFGDAVRRIPGDVGVYLWDSNHPTKTINYQERDIERSDKILPVRKEFFELAKQLRPYANSATNYSIRKCCESDFVEKNKSSVLPDEVKRNEAPPTGYTKVITNDKGGSGGKANWFYIKTDKLDYLQPNVYKVVISSAFPNESFKNSGNIEILSPDEMFGRTKMCIYYTNDLTDAENYVKYMQTNLVQTIVEMTPYKFLYYLPEYNDIKHAIDWTKSTENINSQLVELLNLQVLN